MKDLSWKSTRGDLKKPYFQKFPEGACSQVSYFGDRSVVCDLGDFSNLDELWLGYLCDLGELDDSSNICDV